MSKKMTNCLKIVTPGADEFNVLRWHDASLNLAAVRIHRGFPATLQPIIRLRTAPKMRQHHLLMVAQNRHESTTIAEDQQLLDDTVTIRASINTVAQRYNGVIRLRFDRVEHRAQGCGTAVDIADSNHSGWHERPEAWMG